MFKFKGVSFYPRVRSDGKYIHQAILGVLTCPNPFPHSHFHPFFVRFMIGMFFPSSFISYDYEKVERRIIESFGP